MIPDLCAEYSMVLTNCGDFADQAHHTQSKLLYLHHHTRVCAYLIFLKSLEGEAMRTSIASFVRSCPFYQALVQRCHQFEMSSQVKPIHRLLLYLYPNSSYW